MAIIGITVTIGGVPRVITKRVGEHFRLTEFSRPKGERVSSAIGNPLVGIPQAHVYVPAAQVVANLRKG
jgi:hypothetical protein